jgi:hypothetical protein
MAFWTCPETAASAAHTHDYDEYMVVVQGGYTLIIDGERIPVNAGEEFFIARGVRHSGEVIAGTRTIHAFGGHRATVQNSRDIEVVHCGFIGILAVLTSAVYGVDARLTRGEPRSDGLWAPLTIN